MFACACALVRVQHEIATMKKSKYILAYPIVPAPIQAREIPIIQQQYLDDRHHSLYQPMTTYAAPPPPPPQNVVTVLEKVQTVHTYEHKNGLHHSSFQNPMIENGFEHNNGKMDKSESPMRHNHSNNGKFYHIKKIIQHLSIFHSFYNIYVNILRITTHKTSS